jgi:phosphoadenosine phosphosulfate reductase
MSRLLELKSEALKRLEQIASDYAPATFATSLAAEDMVLTDLILRHKITISIFTLETGRLHKETLAMVPRIKETYGVDITLMYPDPSSVNDYVTTHGENAFYDSIELRKQCCHIRKIEPLNRALEGKRAWITGQRREQSSTRTELSIQEHDAARNMEKFNPLAEWSHEEVWEYIKTYHVPYNPLHNQGYPSIGCEPCTRAISPGEDIRAGRWWWENPETKECGLHVVDGKLVRIKPQ